MHVSGLFPILLIVSISCAGAQVQPVAGSSRSNSTPAVEVFGGFAGAAGGPISSSYGFNGGADFRLSQRFLLVGDVRYFRDPPQTENKMSEILFTGGPRYQVPLSHSSRTSVFGEFLVGGEIFRNSGQAYTYSYNSTTNLALEANGGLNYDLSRHLALRFEGGYLYNGLTNSTYSGPVTPAKFNCNRVDFIADLVYRF
jgi:opacity protein-like surface antigen